MLRFLACLLLLTPVALAQQAAMEVTSDIRLDPARTYGTLIIRKSGVTIDGQGAWLVGAQPDSGIASKDYKGIAILAEGVSDVTLRNVNARGWDTGLSFVRDPGG